MVRANSINIEVSLTLVADNHTDPEELYQRSRALFFAIRSAYEDAIDDVIAGRRFNDIGEIEKTLGLKRVE